MLIKPRGWIIKLKKNEREIKLTRTIKVEGMQQKTKFWVTLRRKISLFRYIDQTQKIGNMLVYETGSIPMRLKPQELDQQFHLLQAAKRVNTK